MKDKSYRLRLGPSLLGHGRFQTGVCEPVKSVSFCTKNQRSLSRLHQSSQFLTIVGTSWHRGPILWVTGTGTYLGYEGFQFHAHELFPENQYRYKYQLTIQSLPPQRHLLDSK